MHINEEDMHVYLKISACNDDRLHSYQVTFDSGILGGVSHAGVFPPLNGDYTADYPNLLPTGHAHADFIPAPRN